MARELEPYQNIERSIIKKFRKEIWRPFIEAVQRYELVNEGDKIAVCISGGKDSMLMAKLMQLLQRYGDVPFELVFLVMDPGYNERNRSKIEQNAKLLEIPVTIFETNIFEVANSTDKSPCYLCARMRRGHLYNKAKELGCNKIALGHHFNDVIETTLIGMFYASQLKAMMPKLHSTNFEGMELIRPMYCIHEDDIIALKTADGTILPFQLLSDGYRNVIKMVLDIATRMCILNPYLKGDALKMTPGIVIIDEIDLSLHPTWQKRIIGILKEQFPRIQFICATHSPFIIQSLDEGELITLDQPLDSEYSGEGLEDIAEDVMGVELPQYSERKRKIYEAASKYYTALKEAKTQDDIARLGKELADLEAEYSDNPAYMAWVHQKYTEQAWKVKKNETSR
jgi:tRNA 2-thiocytidine biosynthesis protein TtcA